jgi:anti-anti-sigma regulatory factor
LPPRFDRTLIDATFFLVLPAFEIAVDEDGQVLRTHFRGVVMPFDLAAKSAQIAALIARLKPGFTVIADLSALERMDLDCVEHIARLMDLFRRAGVGRVLRVIPDADKDIGFTLLSHTHYRGKVPFRTVQSPDEAEAALRSPR